jgi:hypothetical protein
MKCSVCTAKIYGLDDRGSIPGKSKNFSFLHNVQTGSACPIGIGSFRWPGYEAIHFQGFE